MHLNQCTIRKPNSSPHNTQSTYTQRVKEWMIKWMNERMNGSHSMRVTIGEKTQNVTSKMKSIAIWRNKLPHTKQYMCHLQLINQWQCGRSKWRKKHRKISTHRLEFISRTLGISFCKFHFCFLMLLLWLRLLSSLLLLYVINDRTGAEGKLGFWFSIESPYFLFVLSYSSSSSSAYLSGIYLCDCIL